MAAVLASGGAGAEARLHAHVGRPHREDADRQVTVLDYWGAAISHRSAAQLWELLPIGTGPVDVTVPGDGGRRRRTGIRLHRSRSLLPAHVTLRNGIPVTTPARTVADLHRVVSKPDRAGLISARELREVLRLCRRHRLPGPEVNVRVGPHLVDFLWRDRKLVVETDGYASHRGRQAFQDDRGRALDLRARGYEVIRLAGKQVDEEPQRAAEVVSAALRVGADGKGSDDREKGRKGDE
jgi:very-short-patch-repair endonuclease